MHGHHHQRKTVTVSPKIEPTEPAYAELNECGASIRKHERATEHPRAMLVAALEMTLEFAVGLRASALGGGSVMGRLKKNHFMV